MLRWLLFFTWIVKTNLTFATRKSLCPCLLLTILAASTTADAKIGRRQAYLTFSSTYSFYNDIQLAAGDGLSLSSSLDIEMGVKLRDNYSLLFAATQSSDGLRSGYGLGFRVDLPGFFFFGRNRRKIRAKNNPVNTSAYFTSLLTEQTLGSVDPGRSLSTRYGFNIEIFPYNEILYIILDASLYNLNGNTFTTFGLGLGAEF